MQWTAGAAKRFLPSSEPWGRRRQCWWIRVLWVSAGIEWQL